MRSMDEEDQEVGDGEDGINMQSPLAGTKGS